MRRAEGLYHPVAPGELNPIWTAVRVGEDAMSFLPRLRQIASEIDPDAMIQYPASMDQPPNEERTWTRWITLLPGFLSSIARRAFLQLVCGITVGVAVGVRLISMLSDESTWGGNWQLMMAAIAGFVMLVGMLACLAPTRRALRIRPVEALREG
jgi:hypothetical protein